MKDHVMVTKTLILGQVTPVQEVIGEIEKAAESVVNPQLTIEGDGDWGVNCYITGWRPKTPEEIEKSRAEATKQREREKKRKEKRKKEQETLELKSLKRLVKKHPKELKKLICSEPNVQSVLEMRDPC